MLHSHTIPVRCLFVKSAIVRVEYPAKTGSLPLVGAQRTLASPGAAPATIIQLLCKIRRESPRIISIMWGENKRSSGGMHDALRCGEGETSKSMSMFLLVDITFVFALLWNAVHVAAPRRRRGEPQQIVLGLERPSWAIGWFEQCGHENTGT